MKSYNKGHCMDVVSNGLMGGADLMEVFSGRTKNKVFFFVRSQKESSTTTGHGGPSTSQKIQVPDKVDLTSPIPKGGKSTRAYLTEMARDQNDMDCIITCAYQGSTDHVKDNENDVKTDELVVEHANVLTGEPTIVGNVTEDLSFPGLFATEKEQERGRLGEVVAVIHDLSEIVKSLPPFLPITLEEMMKQGKEDNAVCLLLLVAHKSLIQQSYVPFLFDALDRRCKGEGKFLFWVADSRSKEGMKVQSKYGVAVGQTTLLVMVPSHIPQCVEIFNESNLDERKLGEALAQALVQCQDLKEKSDTLKTRRALVTEQDQEFSEQCAEQKKRKQETERVSTVEECAEQEQEKEEIRKIEHVTESSDSDTEVHFGPVRGLEAENLEDTIEDVNEETKKMPKKNKKKKKKKNKNKKRKNNGKQTEEPEEKKICPTVHENK